LRSVGMAALGKEVAEMRALRERVAALEKENKELRSKLDASEGQVKRLQVQAETAMAAAADSGRITPRGRAESTGSLSSRSAGAGLARPPLAPQASGSGSPLGVDGSDVSESKGSPLGSGSPTLGSAMAQCSNCGKLVPAENMSNHSLHCYRHTCRCPMCGVAVPAKERTSHVRDMRGDIVELAACTSRGDVERLREMLQHGADPCAELTDACDTPLHLAARSARIKVIQLALSKGAFINASNRNGETALHLAVLDAGPAALEVVAYLLSQGADTAKATVLGDTPLQLAQRAKNHEAALMLSHSGGALRPSSHGSRREYRRESIGGGGGGAERTLSGGSGGGTSSRAQRPPSAGRSRRPVMPRAGRPSPRAVLAGPAVPPLRKLVSEPAMV